MKSLVSILIPAHNVESLIGDSIESALAQTWPHKEIIVVDDGSSDETLAVARRFESKGVKVISQRHAGASAARNNAFLNCQGDYIQWLDADDLLAPDKIRLQMNAIDRCNSERTLFSSAYGSFIYRTGSAKFVPSALWCDMLPAEWLLKRWEDNVYMQTATWLTSRALTEAAGPWNERLTLDDDGEYFTRVVMGSDGIKFVPDSQVFYRRGFNSLSFLGSSKSKRESQCLSIELQLSCVRSLHDGARVRGACLKFLQDNLNFLYPEDRDVAIQLGKLATELGGKLEAPRLQPIFQRTCQILGWNAARRAQMYSRQIRRFIARSWEKPVSDVERIAQRSVTVLSQAWRPVPTAAARSDSCRSD